MTKRRTWAGTFDIDWFDICFTSYYQPLARLGLRLGNVIYKVYHFKKQLKSINLASMLTSLMKMLLDYHNW
jgi:hypothetical protein